MSPIATKVMADTATATFMYMVMLHEMAYVNRHVEDGAYILLDAVTDILRGRDTDG